MNKICPSHNFEPYEKHGFGYWQKRDCPGDGFYVPGVVEKCISCGMMRLKPEDPWLHSVELER